MCYHTEQKAPSRKLENDFKRRMINPELYLEQHHSNGFSHKNLAVIANYNGEDAIHLFNWGLIVYSGETDHPIPWQTDHLKGWRTVVSNAIES